MALNIPISLNIENLAELNAQVAKMTGAAGGAGAAGAAKGPGAIGSFFGGSGGAGGSTAKGLGQIAKQLPGAGVLGDMGSAFKSGGIIGVGMAGVAGILGFVKQIVESSKVFQSIAGSFFKIFGAMADMFLLPFLPLAMRGMQMLMQHLPKFQVWGQKAADWIEGFISDVKSGGFWNTLRPLMANFENWLATDFLNGLATAVKVTAKTVGKDIVSVQKEQTYNPETGQMEGGGTDWMKTIEKLGDWANKINPSGAAAQQGNERGGGFIRGRYRTAEGEEQSRWNRAWFGSNKPEEGQQFSPTIKRGDQVAGLGGIEEGVGGIMNSMEVSLARQSEKVKDYATQFQQKEVGAGGMLGVWDDEVLRGAIPETWDSISGMYQKMDDELTDEARNAALLAARSGNPAAGWDPGLGKVADEISAALNRMSLSDFVLDSSVASEVENCFIIANQCINSNWQSLSDLVESGVEAVQLGVGGQVMDLSAVKSLVASAQGMGPAIEAEAAAIEAEVALMVQQMSNSDMELTVDTKALSNRIIALNNAVNSRVMGTGKSIDAATQSVLDIAASWREIEASYATNLNPWDYFEGGQFGGIGAAFGDAEQDATDTYKRIRGRTVKRRKQLRPQPASDPYEDPVFAEGVIEEKYGISEREVLDIHQEEFAGEEALDILQEYVNDRIELETGVDVTPEVDTSVFQAMIDAAMPAYAAASSDMDTSRSMDYMWGGEQFGAAGGGGGRRGVNNMSNSVMNISINTRASVQDILSDLRRVQHMDDASFFNSVS